MRWEDSDKFSPDTVDINGDMGVWSETVEQLRYRISLRGHTSMLSISNPLPEWWYAM